MSQVQTTPTARAFTVAVQYYTPIYQSFVVEAANPDAACAVAMEVASSSDHGDWKHDGESSTGYGVCGIASGAHASPYDAPEAEQLATPFAHRSAVVPEIDNAPALVKAANDMLNAFGGNVPDWLTAEWDALALAVHECGGRG